MKLAAADAEDLQILSARLHDATARLADIAWLPGQRRFALLFNRYRWEDEASGVKGTRVRAGLHFEGVAKVQSHNVKLGATDAVVSLLAITFTPSGAAEDPGGCIELVLAGGGAIRLTVEAIDAILEDRTIPWAAIGKPDHEGDA